MKRIILVLMLLLAVTFVCGCVSSGTTIKSQEEASGAVTNVSEGVEKIGEILEGIDKKIG